MLLAVWSWVPWFLNLIVLVLSIFLILLVLIQRGKGGGLAGAFGGAGGSSAFGSRAGDLFTKITAGVVGAWLLIIMIQVWVIQNAPREGQETLGSSTTNPVPDDPSSPPPD